MTKVRQTPPTHTEKGHPEPHNGRAQPRSPYLQRSPDTHRGSDTRPAYHHQAQDTLVTSSPRTPPPTQVMRDTQPGPQRKRGSHQNQYVSYNTVGSNKSIPAPNDAE